MEHTRENALLWLKKECRKTYRHSYRRLAPAEKECYEAFYYGLLALQHTIAMPHTDKNVLAAAVKACLDDNPLLFFTGTIQSVIYARSAAVQVDWSMPEDEIIRTIFVIREQVVRFRRSCRGKTENEIVRAVHDHLVACVTYEISDRLPIHEAHSVFLYHKAVCDGIAKAAKILLDDNRLYSIVMAGRGGTEDDMEPHAWNLVRTNGEWHHYDFTFDLTLTDGQEPVHYDYYALSDGQIGKDHTFADIGLPCPNEADWHRQNGLYFTSKKQLRSHIRSCILHKKPSISFRLPYTQDPLVTRDSIRRLAEDELKHALPPGSSYSWSFNEGQMVMVISYS